MDAEPVSDHGELFSPVSVGRISQVIIEQVRLLIRQGKLKPGDRLPSERALCGRFGVSRVTVREALRVLEATGLVEIRVGARGGAIVAEPSSDSVGEGIADLLTLSALSASEVTETRMVIEVSLIPLVVARAGADDLAELTEICRAQEAALAENRHHSTELSAAFHTRLAGCSHNAAVAMLVQSFHGPLLASLDAAAATAPEMGRRGIEEHLQLVEAIAAKDADLAAEIMRAHLARTAGRLAEA
ncbi:MAG TPA: FadR/GntR family transcriptional regulator [Actinophytocola sp.]|jgi:DNA-binding FadR family transcriptional regulator|nr:FadR/GntR family transcriptional regulator [Actinophytocola sp.]